MDSHRKDGQVDRGGGETAVISDKTIVSNQLNLPIIFGWLVLADGGKICRISTDVFHIGSGKSADLVIGSDALKEIHCSLYFVNDHFEINDNNTRTGTKVNDKIVKRQELQDDDIILLGESGILFKCFRGVPNG